MSKRAISYYKEYFGVSYPLPKYDCIAISDFQCGAMENWGLVSRHLTFLCPSYGHSNPIPIQAAQLRLDCSIKLFSKNCSKPLILNCPFVAGSWLPSMLKMLKLTS